MGQFRLRLREAVWYEIDVEAPTAEDAERTALDEWRSTGDRMTAFNGRSAGASIFDSRQIGDSAPIYWIERCTDDPETWYVIGPNGIVGDRRSKREAQAEADRLNEDVAEERENDA
jgi:hypothetical protein